MGGWRKKFNGNQYILSVLIVCVDLIFSWNGNREIEIDNWVLSRMPFELIQNRTTGLRSCVSNFFYARIFIVVVKQMQIKRRAGRWQKKIEVECLLNVDPAMIE